MTPTNRKTTKPPTLAQLRKLAEAKGYSFVRIYRLPPDDGDKRVFFFVTSSELGGSTTLDITSGKKARVAVLMHAALSALPAVSKGKKGKK